MKRLTVGITGASGIIYAIRLLEAIKGRVETHLILSPSAEKVLGLETDCSMVSLKQLADHHYGFSSIESPLASGSFMSDGMVIIPCSIKTLSAVANSYAESLLVRAADVTLKERRKLILAVRETPLHVGHLDLMKRAAEMGAIILPLTPGFYHRPATIDQMVDQMVGKILDLLAIDNVLVKRWGDETSGVMQ